MGCAKDPPRHSKCYLTRTLQVRLVLPSLLCKEETTILGSDEGVLLQLSSLFILYPF